MKHLRTSLYLAALPLLVACQSESSAPQSSLLLHYDAPAQYFEESLPLGNGQLGALVYGGVEEEKISLNDITLWTGGPDLTPWTPGANQHLARVRGLLNKEDYAAADKANMQIEGHNSEIYQPLGQLRLTDLRAAGQEVVSYGRQLDLNRALATTTYRLASGDSLVRESFASAPDSVIVVRLKAYNCPLSQRVGLACALPTGVITTTADGLVSEGYAAYSTKPEAGKDEWFHYDPSRGIHFRTELRVIAPEGCVKADSDSTLLIEGCDEALLILTDVTSYNGPYCDPVTEGRDYRTAVAQRLQEATAKSYDQLLSRHLEDYQRLFNRVKLDLGVTSPELSALPTDQQLLAYSAPINADSLQQDSTLALFNPDLEELYFQYGRYLLIASSRTEGVPANLQGLWNEYITPPWSCNYTVNINVEENYWPSEVGALPEMHQSFLSWVERLPRSGAITAQNYYGIGDGTIAQPGSPWTVCHNSDLWCMTNPVGYQKESPEWCCWPLGGAWVTTHLWEHYMFTGDRDFLAKAYPVMQGAAAFYLQWLVEKDGYLITSPSTSPENHFITDKGYDGTTLYGGFADIAMIRELLTDVRAAADVLGETEGMARIDSTLARLQPYRIGAQGNLQEWYYDWADKDPRHRHQSHLFGLYPGHHITVDQTPELAAACARTLEIKGSKTTGWSAGWRVNLLAHLRDAQGAYGMLRTLLSFVHPDRYTGEGHRYGGGTYPNLFDAHSPFQIDGNFGGTSGVMEMLVQSRWISDTEAEAYLLPALPAQWMKEGSVSGLRLRGGYELDLAWRDGQVIKVDVKSHRSTPGHLRVIKPDGEVMNF